MHKLSTVFYIIKSCLETIKCTCKYIKQHSFIKQKIYITFLVTISTANMFGVSQIENNTANLFKN